MHTVVSAPDHTLPCTYRLQRHDIHQLIQVRFSLSYFYERGRCYLTGESKGRRSYHFSKPISCIDRDSKSDMLTAN